MKLYELFEAEESSVPKTKRSAYEQLLPYKNDAAVYISMSKNSKPPVSTKSTDAPAGIYAYPLKSTWAKYNVEQNQNFDSYPYANNHPYIHIIKFPHEILATDRYRNLENDIQVLKNRYSHLVNLDKELERIAYKQPFEAFWQLTKYIAKELSPERYQQQWAKILLALNYSGFADTNELIHDGEQVQVLLLNKDKLVVLDTIFNNDFTKRKSKLLSIYNLDSLEEALDDKTKKVSVILRSISGELCQKLQQLLESKAADRSLYEFLHGRSDTDVKLLLLVWLNGVVDFNNVRVNLATYQQSALNDSPVSLFDYAKRNVKFPWVHDTLIHNLELFKSKAG